LRFPKLPRSRVVNQSIGPFIFRCKFLNARRRSLWTLSRPRCDRNWLIAGRTGFTNFRPGIFHFLCWISAMPRIRMRPQKLAARTRQTVHSKICKSRWAHSD
jgi:hypothetical protein